MRYIVSLCAVVLIAAPLAFAHPSTSTKAEQALEAIMGPGETAGIDCSTSVNQCTIGTIAGNTVLNITAKTTGFADIFFNDTVSNEGVIRYSHSADSMSFWTSAASRITIDANGIQIFYNHTGTLPTCNAAAGGGIIFDVDSSEMCYCNGTAWAALDGAGTCS